jgi:spore coat protein A
MMINSNLTLLALGTQEYTGKFVWHCHMLEHEDQDMMRPLVVLPKKPCSCAEPTATPTPTPAPGHEH